MPPRSKSNSKKKTDDDMDFDNFMKVLENQNQQIRTVGQRDDDMDTEEDENSGRNKVQLVQSGRNSEKQRALLQFKNQIICQEFQVMDNFPSGDSRRKGVRVEEYEDDNYVDNMKNTKEDLNVQEILNTEDYGSEDHTAQDFKND